MKATTATHSNFLQKPVKTSIGSDNQNAVANCCCMSPLCHYPFSYSHLQAPLSHFIDPGYKATV